MTEYSDIWKNHPEIQEGEILFSNTFKDGEEITRWRTKRLGNVAYDVYGNQINGRPVFVKKAELMDAGLDPETSGLDFILKGYKEGKYGR